jgi:hypothetical protein
MYTNNSSAPVRTATTRNHFLATAVMHQLVRPVACMLLALVCLPAQAIVISYDLIGLGSNQYRYEYSVTNDGTLASGAAIELFDIMFDPATYLESSLTISTATPLASDWDEIILASAPGVSVAYDALALAGGIANGTSVSGFSVDFIWIGTGVPGGQPFEIYDPVNFALLESGNTLNAVPAPAALWLLVSGSAALMALGRSKRPPARCCM